MKKKIVFLSLMVLCVCLFSIFTTFAANETKDINEEKETVVEISKVITDELLLKENVANDKYNTLLKNWAYDPNLIDDVNAEFPEFYGGAYINDNKELVIQVTTLNDDVRTYFSNMIDLTDTVFEEVKYSYDELKAEKDKLVEKMRSGKNERTTPFEYISGVGISFPENSISLYVTKPQSVKSSADINCESVKQSISSFENIDIIFTSEEDTTVGDVRPGSGISWLTQSRSAGFWAKKANGDIGIITAPHGSITSGTTVKYGAANFGVAQTPYSSVDAVFIKRTNSNMTPSRKPAGWTFELVSNQYAVLAVGSTSYSSGATSGADWGTVKDINYTTSYGLTNTVRTTSACDSGDSGGIVAGGGSSVGSQYAVGIINGKQGGTGYLIYVKASYILQTLNVSVY